MVGSTLIRHALAALHHHIANGAQNHAYRHRLVGRNGEAERDSIGRLVKHAGIAHVELRCFASLPQHPQTPAFQFRLAPYSHGAAFRVMSGSGAGVVAR